MQGRNAQILPCHSHISNLLCTTSCQAWYKFQINSMSQVHITTLWLILLQLFIMVANELCSMYDSDTAAACHPPWGSVLLTCSLFTCLLAMVSFLKIEHDGASSSYMFFFFFFYEISVFIWNYIWLPHHLYSSSPLRNSSRFEVMR
jgi:hypothetical protein